MDDAEDIAVPAPHIVTGQKVSARQLERAKELRDEMTPEERILWNHLKGNRLDGHHFRRQQIIGVYYVDFYCHAAGVVVEVDGEVHQHQQAYDAVRDEVLSGHGLRVLHIRNDEVHQNLTQVLERIAMACRTASPPRVK